MKSSTIGRTFKLRRLGLLGLLLVLALGSSVRAQSVRAEVDRPEVVLGQPFTYTLTLRDDAFGSQPRLSFPEPFELLGVSSSQRFSTVNGRTSSETGYVHTLRAKKAGTFTIQGPTVSTRSGRSLTANPVPVKVLAQAPKTPGKEELLFVEGQVHTREIYLGEVLGLESRVFLDSRFEHVQYPQPVDGVQEGCRIDGVEVGREEGQWRTKGSQKYSHFPVSRKILRPLEAGTLTLVPDGALVQVSERRSFRRRSMFGGFRSLFDDVQQARVAADPIQIKVLPLPSEGRPKDFAGLVGRNLKISAVLDPPKAKVGDPVRLVVTLAGAADLRGVDPPEIEFPRGLTPFETKGSKPEWALAEGEPHSRVRFEWMLVPDRGGEFSLPDLHWTYFDGARGEYQVLSASVGRVLVEGDRHPKPSLGGDSSVAIEAVEGVRGPSQAQKTLRFLREAPHDFPSRDQSQPGSPWLPLGVGLVLAGAIEALARRRLARERDQDGWRASQAASVAQKSLGALTRQEGKEFYRSLAGVMREYVAAKLRRSGSGLRADEIYQGLEDLGASEELQEQTKDLLEAVEALSYSSPGNENPDRDLALVRGWIRDLEKELLG